MPYRYSYVRMFYSYNDEKATPSPFAEFRIFLLSDKQLSIAKEQEIFSEMEGGIEFMEWIFISMMIAVLKKKVYWEIIGKEVQYIDPNEVALDLASTGVVAGYKEFFRYVRFVKKTGKDKEYNERNIRQIEFSRMKQKKFTIISQTTIQDYVEQDIVWWEKISFNQYLKLKRMMMIP